MDFALEKEMRMRKKIKTTKARESKKGGQKRKSYLATFDGW